MTNASGQYSIEESPGSNVTLIAKKTGYGTRQKSATVLPGTILDFELPFIMTTSAAPRYMTSPQSVTLTVSSFAPSDSTVTATILGTTLPMTLQSTTNGTSTWTTTYSVPAGAADQNFVASFGTTRAGKTIAEPASTVFTLDSTGPVITPVAPIDMGNADVSIAGGQPIVATVADALAGVSTSSIRVTLSDNGAPALQVPATVSSGVIRSTAQILQAGHSYVATISASDQAGNSSSTVVRFRAIQVGLPVVTANIPKTDAVSSSSSLGQTTYTFEDVPLHLPMYSATIVGQTAHAGYGFVRQTVPLTAARIRLYTTTPAGEAEVPGSPFQAPATWGTRTTFAQLVTVNTEKVQQKLTVMPLELEVPTLTFTTSIPGTTRAVVELSTVTTPGVPVCGDPLGTCTTLAYPTPDPVPFFINSRDAYRLHTGWIDMVNDAKEHLTEGLCGDLPPRYPCSDVPNLSYMDDYAPGILYTSVFNAVTEKWSLVGPLSPDRHALLYYNLRYVPQSPVALPVDFNELCGGGPASPVRCNWSVSAQSEGDHPGAVTEENGSHSTKCVDKNGRETNHDCFQFVEVMVYEADPKREYTGAEDDFCTAYPGLKVCRDGGAQFHFWQGNVLATYGLNDAGKDQFVVAADTAQDASDPEFFGMLPASDPYLKPKAMRRHDRTETEGVWPDEITCTDVQDAFSSEATDVLQKSWYVEDDNGEPVTNENGQPLGWSGMQFKNLLQYTRYYNNPCPPQRLEPNRLVSVELLGTFYSTMYYSDKFATLQAVFGHNTTGTNWEFGCGVDMGMPPFGCGWSATVERTKAWELTAKTTFQW